MATSIRVLIILALIGALAGGLWWVDSAPRTAAGEAYGLWVDPDSLNFGEVWETDRFEHTLRVENRSDQPLSVVGWDVSCGCLTPHPEHFALGPGKSREVVLTLNLRPQAQLRESGFLDGQSSNDFWVQVRPQVVGPNGGEVSQAEWTVAGRAKPTLICAPRRVEFSRSLQVGRVSKPIILRVTSPRQDLHSIRASWQFGPEGLQVAGERDDFTIVAVLPPQKEPGLVAGRIELIPVQEDGAELPAISIPVSGRVLPDVRLSRESIMLGSGEIATALNSTVTLESVHGAAFHVTKVITHGDSALRIVPSPDTLRGKKTFQVQLDRIPARGSRLELVRFQIKTAAGRTFDVKLAVTWIGYANRGK